MDQLRHLGTRYRLGRGLAPSSVRHALNIRQNVYFQAAGRIEFVASYQLGKQGSR